MPAEPSSGPRACSRSTRQSPGPVQIKERSSIQFRMEAFNVFNRVELGSPNVNLSSPTFGQILSVSNTTPVGSGSARSIQFAARFTF